MANMGRIELLDEMSAKAGISRIYCERSLDALIDIIQEALEEDRKVVIKGFISFESMKRDERLGRDPKTGEVIAYPAKYTAKATFSKLFKKQIARKRGFDDEC